MIRQRMSFTEHLVRWGVGIGGPYFFLMLISGESFLINIGLATLLVSIALPLISAKMAESKVQAIYNLDSLKVQRSAIYFRAVGGMFVVTVSLFWLTLPATQYWFFFFLPIFLPMLTWIATRRYLSKIQYDLTYQHKRKTKPKNDAGCSDYLVDNYLVDEPDRVYLDDDSTQAKDNASQ
ncbi:MAG: hypothetical protein AAFR81_22295 [Chloroflexota bacterium]